jgi:hypothetical protein
MIFADGFRLWRWSRVWNLLDREFWWFKGSFEEEQGRRKGGIWRGNWARGAWEKDILPRGAVRFSIGGKLEGFRERRRASTSSETSQQRSQRMAMLTRGISFRRQGSSGLSWADNWTFTDAGMFRAPKVSSDLEPVDQKLGTSTTVQLPAATIQQKAPVDVIPNVVPVEASRVVPTEPIQVQETTSIKPPHRRGLWGVRWIKSLFRKSKG